MATRAEQIEKAAAELVEPAASTLTPMNLIHDFATKCDALRAALSLPPDPAPGPDPLRDAAGALLSWWGDVEARSADAHAVYQREAHRRGDVRHHDAYEELSDATKEWDRVLVRWVSETIHTALGEAIRALPPDPAPGMEEIEDLLREYRSAMISACHDLAGSSEWRTAEEAGAALNAAIRALAAPGPDRYAEGWREGVLAAREYLRQVWDDGEQGNGDDAAELVLLRKFAEGPVQDIAPAREKEGGR